jgi:phage gp45-like
VIQIDDRRYRLHPLEPGEVAVYTDEGDWIALKRDRKIHINGGGEVIVTGATKLRVESTVLVEVSAPTIAISASTAVTIDAPSVSIQGKPDFKVHHHSGVTTGGGQTGNVV